MNKPSDLNQQLMTLPIECRRWVLGLSARHSVLYDALEKVQDIIVEETDKDVALERIESVVEKALEASPQEPQEHPDTARLDWMERCLPEITCDIGTWDVQVKYSNDGYPAKEWFGVGVGDLRDAIDAAMNGECDEPSADVTDETPVPYQFKGVSDLTIIELRHEAATKGISPTDRRFVEECDAELKRREKERYATPDSTNAPVTPTPRASARQVLAQESTRVGEPAQNSDSVVDRLTNLEERVEVEIDLLAGRVERIEEMIVKLKQLECNIASTITDDGGGEGKTVLDFWYDRAQKAESRVAELEAAVAANNEWGKKIAELESQLSERDDALSEIRARSSEHGMGIVATSELAAAWRKRQQEGE